MDIHGAQRRCSSEVGVIELRHALRVELLEAHFRGLLFVALHPAWPARAALSQLPEKGAPNLSLFSSPFATMKMYLAYQKYIFSKLDVRDEMC